MIRHRRARTAGAGRHLLAPAVLALAGVGLIVAAILTQAAAAPGLPASFGSVPQASATPPGPSRAGVTAPAGVGPVRVQASAETTPVAPTRLWLPGRRRAIAVTPVGVDGSGTLQPPSRISGVGWWRDGAALGQRTGSLVLAGHVDALSQGLGAFAVLQHEHAGQIVRLAGPGHAAVSYRITGRRTYSRAHPLPASVFATAVAARLVLITCTGSFDPRTHHYADSLVVYAVPV